MKSLLHYGLQRSGTNFLESLLTSNYNVRFFNSNDDRSHPSQKHFRLYSNKSLIPEAQYANQITFQSFQALEDALNLEPRIDAIFIISKDPYSWYISYSKWAETCNWPKKDHHYIEEYNHFYRTWSAFKKKDKRIHFIRYIDLISDPEKVLRDLEGTHGLSRKLFRSLFGLNFTIDKVPQSESFSADRVNYYLKRQFIHQLSEEELQSINAKLDLELMEFLNYETILPGNKL